MRLSSCHNFHDFRELARRRLPGPIFNYIDGAADDEITHRRNTASFDRCDLVPNVLRGVQSVDMSVTIMGQTLAMPFYCSPTALQRLFHHDGEQHALTTLPGCISEIARVYRAFKRGDIAADVARTRTYILDKLRAGLEAQTLADLENRLDEAEAGGRADGDRTDQEALMAHCWVPS